VRRAGTFANPIAIERARVRSWYTNSSFPKALSSIQSRACTGVVAMMQLNRQSRWQSWMRMLAVGIRAVDEPARSIGTWFKGGG
jgi:hypothetical protein